MPNEPIHPPVHLRASSSAPLLAALALLAGCTEDGDPSAAAPTTVAAAATTSSVSAIGAAYRSRSREYTPLLRAKLDQIKRLAPATCVAEQRGLLDEAQARGLDGLESLWLAYQDCAARTLDRDIRRAAQANARRLPAAVRYVDEVAYQLPQWTSSHHGLYAREVRGEALRAVMQRLATLEPRYVGLAAGTSLLGIAPVERATCALPARRNGAGTKARAEILRQARCAIPDEETRCSQARAGLVSAFPALSAAEVARLAEACDDTVGGGGLGALGLDALGGFVTGGCVDSLEDGVAQAPGYDPSTLAELVTACYGDGASPSANPLADGYSATYYGSDILGLRGAGLYVWHIDAGGTTYAAEITPDGDFLPLPSVEPGDSATVTNPDGTITTISAGDDGSTSVQRSGTVVNDDGSVTTVDEVSEIGADGSVTTHAGQDTTNPDGSRDRTWTVTTDDGKGNRTEDTTYQGFDANGGSLGSTRVVTATTRNEDGTTTTTTTTTTKDADGHEVVTTNTQAGDALEPGADPTNPACQELTALGYLGRDGVSRVDLEALSGDGIVDPRVVYPAPGDLDPQAGDEACAGSYAQPGLACNLPILCLEGINDDCTCATGIASGPTLQSTSCLTIQCAPGDRAVGGAGGTCQCVSEEILAEEDRPGPGGPGGPGGGCAACL